MAVGWMYNNQKWYYLDENGDMATVIRWISGRTKWCMDRIILWSVNF